AFFNVVGGLIIGVIYKDMTFSMSARKYTILSIGDGLAATISSMMIAISAGFVITRVASEENKSSVSSDIVQQFLHDPKPLWLTRFAIASLSFIPGPPVLLLLAVSLSLGGVAYGLYRKRQR